MNPARTAGATALGQMLDNLVFADTAIMTAHDELYPASQDPATGALRVTEDN